MAVIVTGTTNVSLGEEVSKIVGIAPVSVYRTTFQDGETYIRLGAIEKGEDVFVIQAGAPNANNALIDLLFILDAVYREQPRSVNVILSFCPYRRQERQDAPHAAVGGSIVSRCLSSFPVDRFFCVQPHSKKIQESFSRPFITIPTLSLFAGHLRFLKGDSAWTVVAPDAGSASLSQEFAHALSLQCVVMEKKRSGHDSIEKITVPEGAVVTKNVLLLDDEISTGGTMVENARALRALGVEKTVIAVTHPVLADGAIERLQKSFIDRIIVTNSISVFPKKLIDTIEQVSIAPLIAAALMPFIAVKG